MLLAIGLTKPRIHTGGKQASDSSLTLLILYARYSYFTPTILKHAVHSYFTATYVTQTVGARTLLVLYSYFTQPLGALLAALLHPSVLYSYFTPTLLLLYSYFTQTRSTRSSAASLSAPKWRHTRQGGGDAGHGLHAGSSVSLRH